MREFMTKMSDYLNERRNDPERREDRLAIVIIGAVAVVVIVLLLLLLWGHASQERRQKEDESDLATATYEEKAQEYMAQNDGQEAFRQEYLESMGYLNDRIEELLDAMAQVERELSETVEQYGEEDASMQRELTSLRTEVGTIVYNLRETQTKLYDLIDIVQVMDEKTIPMLQEQIVQIRGDVDGVHTDIANLYARIAALEQEDVKLWASINNVEKALQTVLDRNMTEVNNQLDAVTDRMEQVENRVGRLDGQILRYRYDRETNTLHLEPYNN